MNRMRLVGILLAGLVIVSTHPASGATLAPGSLDPSFGTGGRSDPVLHGSGSQVSVQPDGKVVALGHENSGGYLLVRYNPDGTLDSTFGDGGQTWTGRQQYDGRSPVMATQVDDTYKTIVRLDKWLLRFDDSGVLDPTFGDNGRARNPNNYPVWIDDIETTPAGDRIVALGEPGKGAVGVVVGWVGDYEPTPQPIFAYTRDGKPDASFGHNGMVLFGLANTRLSHLHLKDVTLQPDGHVVATGGNVTIRLHPDGRSDRSFGRDGIVVETTSPLLDNRYVQVDPSGRVLVMRCKKTSSGFATLNDGCEIVRYLPEGGLDTSFGTLGRAALPNYAMRNFAIDSNGRIVVFGARWSATDPDPDLTIVRLLPDGSLDTSFGDVGAVLTPSYYLGTLPPSIGALQADDKIVRTGTVWEFQQQRGYELAAMYVWRYLADAEDQPDPQPTDATLTGIVTDARTGAAIAGATIDCGQGYATTTGPDGRYSLQLPLGDRFCTASASGYRAAKARVSVTEPGATQDFRLRG